MNHNELANSMTIEDILILIKIKQEQAEQKERQVEKVCVSLIQMGYTEGSPLLEEAEKESDKTKRSNRSLEDAVQVIESAIYVYHIFEAVETEDLRKRFWVYKTHKDDFIKEEGAYKTGCDELRTKPIEGPFTRSIAEREASRLNNPMVMCS